MAQAWNKQLDEFRTRREFLYDLHHNQKISYNDIARNPDWNPQGRSAQTIQRLVKKVENEQSQENKA